MKKILFVVCTHGDELAPLQLFLRHPYGQTEKVEWEVLVANWKAALTHTRFVDDDLNRLFGENEKNSPKSWESTLVPEIRKRISQKNYDVVYDVHTTTRIKPKETPDCIFINANDKKNLHAVSLVKTPFVIWDSNPIYNQQYLTSCHPVGVTLEYQKTALFENDVARILSDFHNITHEKVQGKKMICKADQPITQKEAKKYKLSLKDFVPLTVQQKKLLRLPPKDNYLPVFINPPEIDPINYCFLNKEVV